MRRELLEFLIPQLPRVFLGKSVSMQKFDDLELDQTTSDSLAALIRELFAASVLMIDQAPVSQLRDKKRVAGKVVPRWDSGRSQSCVALRNPGPTFKNSCRRLR